MSGFPLTDSFLIRELYTLKQIDTSKCEFIWKLNVCFLKSFPLQNKVIKSIEEDSSKNAKNVLLLMKERLADVLVIKKNFEERYQYNLHSASSRSNTQHEIDSEKPGTPNQQGREISGIHEIQEEEEVQETEANVNEGQLSEGQLSLKDESEELMEEFKQVTRRIQNETPKKVSKGFKADMDKAIESPRWGGVEDKSSQSQTQSFDKKKEISKMEESRVG